MVEAAGSKQEVRVAKADAQRQSKQIFDMKMQGENTEDFTKKKILLGRGASRQIHFPPSYRPFFFFGDNKLARREGEKERQRRRCRCRQAL